MDKIKTFSDLNAWKESYRLVLRVYQYTSKFPKEEVYALTSQMRRSVVSFASNIAEGFSRRTSKDKINFYYMALGSLTELQNQLIIAKGLIYLNDVEFELINKQTVVVHKLINGLIKGVQKIRNT